MHLLCRLMCLIYLMQNCNSLICLNKIDRLMNELVIDKRIFLQPKKRSNTKTILPQIKYPLNFNMNGSSILRKLNDQILPNKQTFMKQKTYQAPLSNILVSKRITPMNPEQSPSHIKRKQNHSYAPKQQSSKKIQAVEIGLLGHHYNQHDQHDQHNQQQDQKRKTSTSLSQRVHRRAHQRMMASHVKDKEDVKNIKVNRNDQLLVYIGKANNNQDLVREILNQRKIWKQIKLGQGIPHLKWVFSKQRHNYKKMWSFTQTKAINHFQFNQELTTKDNLIRNLQLYCQTKKLQIFTLTPITFIIDFDDQYCEYNMKQFLSFFMKNDPRKNNPSQQQQARRNGYSTTYNFINKFQSYMAWQNSDIKKKVNILSRPVNNSTYYSSGPQPGYVWLLKPTGLNRGRGIQIFDNLEDLEKMLMEFLASMNRKNYGNNKEKKRPSGKTDVKYQQSHVSTPSSKQTEQKQQNQLSNSQGQQQQKNTDDRSQLTTNQQISSNTSSAGQQKFCRENFKLSTCSFVIQKYVQRPFLIQKRKFDIRVWTLLSQSLHLYFFKQGYIRTSAQEFQLDDIHNYFIHLTNNAIQKNSASYGLFQNGNQLSFKDLSKIIGEEQTQKIWQRMKQIAYMAYCSVNKKINMNQRKFCFELFGLDFIIDEDLKVWLIQINENPCIECASSLLGKLIPRMINDAFKITIDQIFPDKKPAQKVYHVPGYGNNQNMWQLLGQLGPNAQYAPQKQSINKESIIQGKQKQKDRQNIRQPHQHSNSNITLNLRELKQQLQPQQQQSKQLSQSSPTIKNNNNNGLVQQYCSQAHLENSINLHVKQMQINQV